MQRILCKYINQPAAAVVVVVVATVGFNPKLAKPYLMIFIAVLLQGLLFGISNGNCDRGCEGSNIEDNGKYLASQIRCTSNQGACPETSESRVLITNC